MTDSTLIYSSLMRLQIDRMNSIAENASNVNSTGYLQEKNYIDPKRFISLLQGKNIDSGFVSVHSIELGALKITNRNIDIAIASDHWFVVEKNQVQAITRNGNFQISNEGELMLGDYFVVGNAGRIRGITASEDVSIGGDGLIFIKEAPFDQLKIVSIDSSENFAPKGNGIYEVSYLNPPIDIPKVIQGALNQSNVNVESDMTKMIEISRHIESIQRAISAHDDMLNVGINQLGK